MNQKKSLNGDKNRAKRSASRTDAALNQRPLELVLEAIYRLPNERMQEVLVKRFGLDNPKLRPETLEAIGKKFMITRERVRQIENEAIKRVEREKQATRLIELILRVEEAMKNKQGIMSERRIFNEFGKLGREVGDQRALLFVLRVGQRFYFLNRPKELERAWYLKGTNTKVIDELNKWLTGKLEEGKKTISKRELIAVLNEHNELKKIDDEILYTYVDIPARVQENIFKRWGLVNWPEIKPRGVRDKIYLAFKRANKPLHFSEVAEEVNALGVDKRRVCQATVHNELIKDPRFILIGRGIYALREWNYKPGTVADILGSILKKAGRPMTKEALTKEVLKQRKVKKSTIVLNLHNSKLFKREAKDLYALRTEK